MLDKNSSTSDRLIHALSSQFATRVATLGISGSGIVSHDDLSIGEVIRHFDTETKARVTGWLDHSLQFKGWGIGVSTGRVGIGTGRLGLVGGSAVDLTLTGHTKADLMGDGLVAVFDTPSFDTIRMVCPSEQVTSQIIAEFLRSLRQSVKPSSWLGEALTEYEDVIISSYSNRVSYVSDRLSAVLRAPSERRPTFRLSGLDIGHNALLGSAIQIGEDEWNPLFPCGLVNLLSGVDSSISPEPLGSVDVCRVSVRWIDQKNIKKKLLSKAVVRIDGQKLGELGVSEGLQTQLGVGRHILSVKPPSQWFYLKEVAIEFQVVDQDDLRFVCGLGTGLGTPWRLRRAGTQGHPLRD